MAEFTEKCSIEAVCIRETEKAIQCQCEDGKEHWIPKSQIDDDSEVYRLGNAGLLIVNQWFWDKEFAKID